MAIGSYRFLDFASRHVMKAWAVREKGGDIPFTPSFQKSVRRQMNPQPPPSSLTARRSSLLPFLRGR